MNYLQTVDYLLTRLPMFSRIGIAAFKKDLTNTLKLCAYLGDPHLRVKTIHVGGTNGKGSCSHMLASILQEAGYSTGLYTSPHLKDFRERIKLDGNWIEEDFVIDFVERIRPMIEEIQPSFFEITVAMAFDYFVSRQVDIAVVEVGLGGRLDSTNVITPELAVITNIGYDHMNMLGDTLEKIGIEKAGIIKSKVPVVIGEKQPETYHVFREKAEEMHAPISFADQQRFISDWKFEKHRLVAEVTAIRDQTKEFYQLDLQGIYQLKNLVTVLESVHILRQKGWKIREDSLHRGLDSVRKTTGLHGRWEIVHEHPLVVLDVAHNEDGIRQVVSQMEVTDHANLHIVIGMVKDKETKKILSYMPKQAHYYFTRAWIPRALPEDELSDQAKELGLFGEIHQHVNEALESALEKAGAKDLIVVCGSVFLVGELDLSFGDRHHGN